MHIENITNFLFKSVEGIKMFKSIRKNKLISSRNLYTRNIDLIQPVYKRLQNCQIEKLFSGPKDWNCLPKEIRNKQTISKFKQPRKIHLLSLYRV